MKQNENKKNEHQLTFKFQEFEGPLDLLLHLIRQNKMNIYDIPMADLTEQYIHYLHEMQTLQLDVAGEYLVMAAMLLNIKSKMLLPNESEQDTEIDDEYEDPREELVQQLLLHEIFQTASGKLTEMAENRQQKYSREQGEVPGGTKLGRLSDEKLSSNLLQQAFTKLLARKTISKPVQRKLETEKYTIKGEIKRVRTIMQRYSGPIKFDSLFGENVETEELVTTFLALLELTKRGDVQVSQVNQLGPIILEKGKTNAV